MNNISSSSIDNKAVIFLQENNLLQENNTPEQLNKIYESLDEQLENSNLSIDDVLLLDFLDIEDFYKFVSKEKDIKIYNLAKLDLHLHIDHQIDTHFLESKLVVPIREDSLSIEIATYNPYDKDIVYELMKRLGKNVILSIIPKEQLQRYIHEIVINRDLEDIIQNIKIDLNALNKIDFKEESNTVKMLELILEKGLQNRASDIHLEYDNEAKKALVRFRIDGILHERFEFEEEIYMALSSTLKLFANIDFVNNTKAQDGRFSHDLSGVKYDFRISVIPLFNGESISVRILQTNNILVQLDELGLSKKSYEILDKVSKYPHGLILVTGPTGSGKTTTLYSTLSTINDSQKKIITVEDPVEYQLAKIQQIQVKIRSDINFSSILKSILRHDPDIIMIGEVRDKESLKIAVESALTGHLVFTTLHTNDAISSIIRLKEMGVEDYLIANSLLAVHSQRLVRRLCQKCIVEHEPNKQMINDIKKYLPKDYKFFYSEGCNECSMTGFVGRSIICETVFINDELSSALTRSMDYETLKKVAIKNGFVSMIEDGISKALSGETSLNEVFKVVYV
ncbi:Type IV fimbrial assembly, ATPase PilB [hydrothermal vent metagenome]|uniref:Type IV fimbrial assembly, ATPase PilB n=1 Tax=hydrothermal vent metagenome TaxID=652676 RepID=A0A3B1E5Y8_9ZZZZ